MSNFSQRNLGDSQKMKKILLDFEAVIWDKLLVWEKRRFPIYFMLLHSEINAKQLRLPCQLRC